MDNNKSEIIRIIREVYDASTYNKNRIYEFWDTVSKAIDELDGSTQLQVKEYESQIHDLEHEMIGLCKDGSKDMSSLSDKEKLKIYAELEMAAANRREFKDLSQIIQISKENSMRTRNFILGMDRRKYSPKSMKYRPEEEPPQKTRISEQPTSRNFKQVNGTTPYIDVSTRPSNKIGS